MGIKTLINKGKCIIGMHEGEWGATSPSECTFTRVCSRCGAVQHKVDHPWEDWGFVAEASCNQVRTCRRCQLREQRVTHRWAGPEWIADASCEQQQVCERCRAVRPAAVRHVMDQWRYLGADACIQVQQCSRCRADGTRRQVVHLWGDWQHSNVHNCPVRVCRRCAEIQTQPLPSVPPQPALPVATAGGGIDRENLFEQIQQMMNQYTQIRAAITTFDAAGGAEQSFVTSAATVAADSRSAPAAIDRVAALGADVGSQRDLDARLVGHWRHTEAMSGSGFSRVCDTHLVLDDEGHYARWSRTVSGLGDTQSDALRGSWQCRQNELILKPDDGDENVLAYTVDANGLFFPNGGAKKYWERVS